MKIPLAISEVTPEWLKEVMEDSLKEGPVQVTHLDFIKNRAGYLGENFKAKVKLQDGNELALFIKIGVSQEDPYGNLVASYDLEANEARAYSEGLPMLVNFEKEHLGYSELEGSLPKVYASGHFREGDKRGCCFVMEDLTTEYKMIPNVECLSLQQLELVLGKLGRFHGLSYCYSSIHKMRWPKEHRLIFGKFYEEKPNIEKCQNNFPLIVEDFQELPHARHLIPYVEKLAKNFQQAFIDCIQFDERFLNHGDFWSNNVMFSHDDSKVKMYDWQFFGTASPYYDFKHMAFMSALPEQTEAWQDKLYDAYFNKLTKTCQDFKVDLPFTREEFIHDCNKKGMFAGITIFVFFYELARKEGAVPKLVWLMEKAVKYSPEFFDYKK